MWLHAPRLSCLSCCNRDSLTMQDAPEAVVVRSPNVVARSSESGVIGCAACISTDELSERSSEGVNQLAGRMLTKNGSRRSWRGAIRGGLKKVRKRGAQASAAREREAVLEREPAQREALDHAAVHRRSMGGVSTFLWQSIQRSSEIRFLRLEATMEKIASCMMSHRNISLHEEVQCRPRLMVPGISSTQLLQLLILGRQRRLQNGYVRFSRNVPSCTLLMQMRCRQLWKHYRWSMCRRATA
mmetsp:Transcript_125299/g.196320  ORF Transcript_125299/g.196320 Transcript_125299/m.196320 type:complete len:242 (-) Transcript_125299:111-836(-)